jgi:hypothetical protein
MPASGMLRRAALLTKTIRWNIPEDGILYSYRCENLKYYIALTSWTL